MIDSEQQWIDEYRAAMEAAAPLRKQSRWNTFLAALSRFRKPLVGELATFAPASAIDTVVDDLLETESY